MAVIKNYITQDDGTTTIVVEGVDIADKTKLLMDNGIEVECDVSLSDPFKVTDKQRRKVFALLRDIYDAYGQPIDYLRYLFQEQLKFLNGYREFSMSDCSIRQCSELIELIIDFMFENDIPMRKATSDLLANDRYFLYKSTISRICVLCGAPNSQLAHYHAVGRGRDRKKVDHTGNKVLALCHKHHQEQHNMGMDSFNSKYHLKDSWVEVDERLNKMLQYKK